MKKIVGLSSFLLCLAFSTSVTGQLALNSESSWVLMRGEVKNFGFNYAFGWCGVYAEVDGWARVFIAWMPWGGPQIPEIINFNTANLSETQLVKLNYAGSDLYIEGLWDVYNVTYILQPGEPGNYTLQVELLVDDSFGTLSVTGGWTDFSVSITHIDEIQGEVTHYTIRPGAPIPVGDVSSPTVGVPDGIVNICDIVYAAKKYGMRPGVGLDFKMFSIDFNFDYKIDIIDLTTIAVNIGES